MENQNDKIKVAIVDDHFLYRETIAFNLPKKKFDIIFKADNGQHALNLLKNHKPDVILLDANMPIMNGFTTLLEIRKLYPEIRIVVLLDIDMDSDTSQITRFMEYGANGCLSKNAYPEEIGEALIVVHAEEHYFNDLVTAAFMKNLNSKKSQHRPVSDDQPLTEIF